jgi:hypothetical protein
MKNLKQTVKDELEKDQDTKPEESTSTFDVEQRVRLMELAHKETLKLGGCSWEDTYKKMVELITAVPEDPWGRYSAPGEKQKITIIKYRDTSFTICHKHEEFSFETYGARSFEGVIKMIENLLNGYKPTLGDRYLKSSLKPPVHTNGFKEPEPLD